MKKIHRLAAMLAAVFAAAFWLHESALAEEAFAIDQRQVLQGMQRAWLQGYEPTIVRDTMTLVLPIASQAAQGAVEAEIILADEQASPFKLQAMRAKAQQGEGGLWPLRFTLAMHADRRNGDYAAVIRVTGQDAAGSPLCTDIPYVFRIRDGAPTEEAVRMEITEVASSLKVGEDGWISATLRNPCQTVPFEQIALRITDGSGEILPGASDTVYLPALGPGETYQLTFPAAVLAKAAVARHSVTFACSWVALGQKYTQEECYALPVGQEIRLAQGGLKMPASVVAGDPLTLTLPVMNMGRGELVNVLATLRLPGITEGQSVLVGTLAPGETKQAQLTVTPDKGAAGDYAGTLTVEATDSDGNPADLTMPMRLAVEAPVQRVTADAPAAEQAAEEPWLTWALGGGCGLLALLLLAQGMWLRRKIHRMEEERL